VQSGLSEPNSEDAYVHVVPNLAECLSMEKPTRNGSSQSSQAMGRDVIDARQLAYHGVTLADNYINSPALTAQKSAVDAVGHALRVNLVHSH